MQIHFIYQDNPTTFLWRMFPKKPLRRTQRKARSAVSEIMARKPSLSKLMGNLKGFKTSVIFQTDT